MRIRPVLIASGLIVSLSGCVLGGKPSHTITVEVTGTAPSAYVTAYSEYASPQLAPLDGEMRLPYSKSFKYAGDTLDYYLQVRTGFSGVGQTITCIISFDGKEVNRRTGSAAYEGQTCAASLSDFLAG